MHRRGMHAAAGSDQACQQHDVERPILAGVYGHPAAAIPCLRLGDASRSAQFLRAGIVLEPHAKLLPDDQPIKPPAVDQRALPAALGEAEAEIALDLNHSRNAALNTLCRIQCLG
jgi:hypothetical protein